MNIKFNLKSQLKPDFQKIIFLVIFIAFIFLRFYQLEERMQFSWDQVDNAWVSKNLIVDHVFPIYGMPVNQGSGFNIGPLYYYIISLSYYIFNLDPIGAGIFAGLTSVATAIVLIVITKKIFSTSTALFTLFIYTFSNYIIIFDRISWPVNFIPLVSLLIFYFLFKAITDNKKYLLLLACALGFSFHIHFTSILYLFIILFCAPYFVNKKSVKYVILSILVFVIWITPSLAVDLISKNQSRSFVSFFSNTFHGFHLRRVLQIARDAFIEFPGVMGQGVSNYAYTLFPAFVIVYLWQNKIKLFQIKLVKKSSKLKFIKELVVKREFIIFYLIVLWFVIPWMALSTYRGTISNYYFSLTRPVMVITVGYLLCYVYSLKNYLLNTSRKLRSFKNGDELRSKNIFLSRNTPAFKLEKMLFKFLVFAFLAYFAYTNITVFINYKAQGLFYYKKVAKEEVGRGMKNQFLYGAPESYLHYLYERSVK